MQGTVAFLMQASIRPFPPLGIRRSTYPLARISSFALSLEVSSIKFTRASGKFREESPFLIAATIALAELNASFPPLRTLTFPLLRQSAATSAVTLGRLS